MTNNKHCSPHFPPILAIPESFEECLTYGERQLFLYEKIQDLEERVEALENQETEPET